MMMALLLVVTLLSTTLWYRVRASEEQQLRWRAYALRDRLRWHAIQNESFRKSWVFWKADHFVTSICASLDGLSLWWILVIMLRRRFGTNRPPRPDPTTDLFYQEIMKPQHTEALTVVLGLFWLMLLQICLRHAVLTVLLAPLLGIALWVLIKYVRIKNSKTPMLRVMQLALAARGRARPAPA
jgi:hypothetical protein